MTQMNYGTTSLTFSLKVTELNRADGTDDGSAWYSWCHRFMSGESVWSPWHKSCVRHSWPMPWNIIWFQRSHAELDQIVPDWYHRRCFWHATLRLRSAIRRHHPPQRAVPSQICCFGSVRWCCLRSCWTVLSHVMRGRPGWYRYSRF